MAKDIFKYDYRQYGRDTGLSDKQIREEYSRLRDIAQKRIKRLSESEWTDTQTYLEHKEGFKKVADIPANQMKNALSDIYRFLHNQTSSISGLNRQRQLAVQTLRENDYKFINKKNYKEFFEFMNYAKDIYKDKYQISSDETADLFDELKRRDIDIETVKEDFEFWIDNLEELKELPVIRSKDAEYNADYYRNLLE